MLLNIDRKRVVYTQPVEITSPDQFVPLFLAYQSPVLYKYDSRLVHMPQSLVGSNSRKAYKKALLEQLNHSYPKYYALPKQDRKLQFNPRIHSSTENYQKDKELFLGLPAAISNYNTRLEITRREFNILPGYLGYETPRASESGRTYRYPSMFSYTHWSVNYDAYINSVVLITVQAKYIPYLRARIALHLDWKIPVGGLKVIRNTAYTGSSNSTINSINIDVSLFIQSQNPEVVLGREEDFQAYFRGTRLNKSVIQQLEAAVLISEDINVLEPMNV